MTGDILTPKQEEWLAKHKAPCGHSVALEYIDWLSAHKRMENDVNRMIVLKNDIVGYIQNAPNYAVALAVVSFLENNDKWFPPLAEIQAEVERWMVPATPLYAETNAYQMAKDLIGEAQARSWFKLTVLHEGILYCGNQFAMDWIKNNYAQTLKNVVSGYQLCKIV